MPSPAKSKPSNPEQPATARRPVKPTTAEIIERKRRRRARQPQSGVTIAPDEGGGLGPDVRFGQP